MSILHISGSHSDVTASGLVLLYEGLGRHNGCSTENKGLGRHYGYNTENGIFSPIRYVIRLIWRT